MQDKTKQKKNGKVDKYKVHSVVEIYKQEFAIDYKKIFSLVLRQDTVR